MTRLSDSTNVKRAASIAGSTAAAHAIVALSLPLLAVAYTPADFGVFGTYVGLVTIVGSVIALRYDSGIAVAGTTQRAAELFWVSAGVICVSAAIWPAGLVTARVLGIAAMDALFTVPATLLGIGLFAQGAFQLGSNIAVREERFRSLAISKLGQSLTQVATQAFASLYGAGGVGLMMGDVAGRFVGALATLRRVPLMARASFSDVTRAAREDSHLASHLAPATFLTMLASQLPLLCLPQLFGADVAGQYFFAYRLTYLPATLFASGMAPVLLAHLARQQREKGPVDEALTTGAWTLAAICLPAYLLIGTSGPMIVRAAFGEAWDSAAWTIRMLAFPAAVWAIANPLSSILLVKARGREAMLFATFDIAAKAACLTVGAAFASFQMAIWLLAGSSTCLGVFSIRRFVGASRVPTPSLRPVASGAELAR